MKRRGTCRQQRQQGTQHHEYHRGETSPEHPTLRCRGGAQFGDLRPQALEFGPLVGVEWALFSVDWALFLVD